MHLVFFKQQKRRMQMNFLVALILLSGFPKCQGFHIFSQSLPIRLVEFPARTIISRPPPISAELPLLALQASPSSGKQEGDTDNDTSPPLNNEGLDLSLDERLYRVRLSRFPGIEWGTDLSFAFVYVRALDPTGAASMSGQVAVGDQLCELRAIVTDNDGATSPQEPVNLLGAPFDYVMTAFATLSKGVQDVDLVFFRGTQEDLKVVCTGDGAKKGTDTVTITVVQNKGSPQEQILTLTAPAGCNVRELLINNNINVYQSITRWTNCKGKQLCGTCIVNVTEGSLQTNRKSMDEASTLRENPESYRLSCITFAYGDITVETFPPIEAAQWTR
jgi:ferredoxin